MASHNPKEEELRRREKELQEREYAVRLRELEAELDSTPIHRTVKHREPRGSVQQWTGKLVEVAKFLAIVLAVVVTLRIAAWLTTVVIVGAIAWVAYNIFWGNNRPKR